MKGYFELLDHILNNGTVKADRTGTGTISTFGYQMRYNLNDGFPLVTTKLVSFRLLAYELLWFLKGDTNIHYLLKHNNNIWNEWAFEEWVNSNDYDGIDMTDFAQRSKVDASFNKEYEREMKRFKEKILNDSQFAKKFGDLGNIYGKQWRSWAGFARKKDGTNVESTVDQISEVIKSIKENPNSRRHLVSAWNVSELSEMRLPPCHIMFQFYVDGNRLSCQLYQRSLDAFLGCPFNIASYSLLLSMVAQVCDLVPHEFIHTVGDAHIYLDHVKQVETQMRRIPKKLPVLKLNPQIKNIFDFEYKDIELLDYNPYPSIKAPVSV